jgi:hypothetical protein
MDGCPLWVLCVLSGTGLCDGLITRPEESYRLWCVLVCDLGISKMRRLKLIKGCKCRIEKNIYVYKKIHYVIIAGLYSKPDNFCLPSFRINLILFFNLPSRLYIRFHQFFLSTSWTKISVHITSLSLR